MTVQPLVKQYDNFLVHTHTDRIEIFNEDITNPIVILPIAFAKVLAADLVEHTTGALDELERPELTTLTLITTLIPGGLVIANPTEDGVYQCPVQISNLDVFTSLTLKTSALMGMDTDPVDVYIDGDKNGSMQTLD
jgi:hypothetical protein